jgi:ribosomal subunit interface protein
MNISTSSHNMPLTDEICAFVEDTVRNEFDRAARNIVSVDARLEATRSARDRHYTKAVIRVDLRNHRALATEIQDDNVYAAVRRCSADLARAIDRQLQHSSKVNGQRITATSLRPAAMRAWRTST